MTMSTDAPFKILSVSPPLHFGKHNSFSSTSLPQRPQTSKTDLQSLVVRIGSVKIDEHVVFSVSMAFFPTKSAADLAVSAEWESPWGASSDSPGSNLSHGWLDDTLVVGAGFRDEAYGSIHLPMATALRGHALCP